MLNNLHQKGLYPYKKDKFGKGKTTMDALINRITLNPEICHGKPTIRNMRYPVEMILDLLSSGMTFNEIMEDYPAIEEEDIKACLAFASRLTKIKAIHKVVA
ncbi:DUF433 domain-containing protein [Rufibacter sp. XAAS-G3-1]|uniref:DUF433 domain-containing protein n=1 Tax=Rufibacter sp. XAAS-G3-1 TaxID=2729134 RepID=UPI00351A2DC0